MINNTEKVKLGYKVRCPFCNKEASEVIVQIGSYKNEQIPRCYTFSLAQCPHCKTILPINVAIVSSCNGSAYSVSEDSPSID
jgi:phage FluMu protein Com